MARSAIVPSLVVALVTMLMGPAVAEDARVTVRPDRSYGPATVLITPGDHVTWFFVDPAEFHTVSDRTGLVLFESGARRAGNAEFSYTFDAAGTYAYYCQFHLGMVGTVLVTMQAEKVKGGSRLLWAERDAEAGFVYDVRVKAPRETKFTSWLRGTTEPWQRFEPTRRGTYQFRARLRRVSDRESTGYSPALPVEGRSA